MCASRSLAWIQFQNERDDARTAFCTDTTREESAQNERSRVFIIRLCHHRKKKLQRRAIRLGSLRQFNTRREEKEMRVRGLKNAERRKAHNDATADDDDEKEEEEKKGEKESRKARREKIPP